MSTRYAIAVHRIKDAERLQDAREQLSWASNEMASILKEGDPAIIDLPIVWAGLAMAHRAQHEIADAYLRRSGQTDLDEADELALYTLKQVCSLFNCLVPLYSCISPCKTVVLVVFLFVYVPVNVARYIGIPGNGNFVSCN